MRLPLNLEPEYLLDIAMILKGKSRCIEIPLLTYLGNKKHCASFKKKWADKYKYKEEFLKLIKKRRLVSCNGFQDPPGETYVCVYKKKDYDEYYGLNDHK